MRIALILSDCLMIYIGGPIDYPLLYSSSVIRLLIVVIEEQVYVWVAVLSELSSLHDTRRSHLILAICHLSEEHCKNFPPLSLSLPLSQSSSLISLPLSLSFSVGDQSNAIQPMSERVTSWAVVVMVMNVGLHTPSTLIISITWPVRTLSRDITARVQWRAGRTTLV